MALIRKACIAGNRVRLLGALAYPLATANHEVMLMLLRQYLNARSRTLCNNLLKYVGCLKSTYKLRKNYNLLVYSNVVRVVLYATLRRSTFTMATMLQTPYLYVHQPAPPPLLPGSDLMRMVLIRQLDRSARSRACGWSDADTPVVAAEPICHCWPRVRERPGQARRYARRTDTCDVDRTPLTHRGAMGSDLFHRPSPGAGIRIPVRPYCLP